MLLNNKGHVVNKADKIIRAVKKTNPDLSIIKECAKNMIELGCYPEIRTYSSALSLFTDLQQTLEIAKKQDLNLHFMGTYPGKFDPAMRKDPNYKIKKQIFGEDRFLIAGRCIGFHSHYTLPKAVYDHTNKRLRLMINSKLKRSMLNSYNFEVAIDPALTMLIQSSPFYQGMPLAKDSRVIVYRGGKKLKYKEGLYAKLQQIGGLQPYKQTGHDLFHTIERKVERWKRAIKKVDKEANIDKMYKNRLDMNWNPVKINAHGTLEQRGMDMNYPSHLIAVSVLLKFCLKKIQREFIEALPTDIGIEEPFKLENNILHIPPHSLVRNKLQYQSAYHGFDNKEVAEYTKRFFKFAKSVTPKYYSKILRPINNIVNEEKTVSDKIRTRARRLGWDKGYLDKPTAAELALKLSETLESDLKTTIALLEKI
ncbi:hypothetical protein KY331_04705 [Candidatus Woesearchaeota archaeon]|nr:hypothetical protein [Candidatus Woesearchaeota archaeon]